MWPKARDEFRHTYWGPGPERDMIRWRRAQLQRAGFDPDLAARVAADRSMDVHALLELVDLGCAPALATRILAPLEHEGESC